MIPLDATPNAAANTADFEFAALQEAVNYRKAIREAFRPYLQGSVIEIGAGIGQMTAEFLSLDRIQHLLPVEPDVLFSGRLRENYPSLSSLEGTIQDVPVGSAWDGIVSINVLEHILHDEEELQNYQKLLAINKGHLCLLIPARPEIYSPIDKDFGHFRRYTKDLLKSRLEQAGFDIVELRYFNLVGYFAWFWTFKIMRARNFTVKQVRLFDHHIFPFTQAWEQKFASLPFGQSLLAVARA